MSVAMLCKDAMALVGEKRSRDLEKVFHGFKTSAQPSNTLNKNFKASVFV